MGIFSDFLDDLSQPDVNTGLLEYFSSKVLDNPSGAIFSYKKSNEGEGYILTSEAEMKLVFKGKDLPTYIKNKGITDTESLGQYLYRTQQNLNFESAKLYAGSHEIDPTKVYLTPLSETPYPMKGITNFAIIPKEFPEPHKIDFIFENAEESFLMKRQPFDSASKVWFKSVDNKPLEISYYFDESSKKLSFNLDFKILRSTSIEEGLKYSKLTDEFFKGKVSIGNEKLLIADSDATSASSTPLLEALLKIENYFKVNVDSNFRFNPQKHLSNDDYYFVHQLYYSLILQKAFKYHESINTFEMEKNSSNKNFTKLLAEQEVAQDKVGFMTEREERRDLLGQIINLSLMDFYQAIQIISIDETDSRIIVRFKQNNGNSASGYYYIQELPGNSDVENLKEKLTQAEEMEFF